MIKCSLYNTKIRGFKNINPSRLLFNIIVKYVNCLIFWQFYLRAGLAFSFSCSSHFINSVHRLITSSKSFLVKIEKYSDRGPASTFLIRNTCYNAETEVRTKKPKRQRMSLPEGSFHFLQLAYDGPTPNSKAKFDDVQHLKKFCSVKAPKLYEALAHL